MNPNVPQNWLDAVSLMFENLLLRTDPELIEYWSNSANGMFLLAGFALAALFAVLALKRDERHGPVSVVALLLLLSSFGFVVAGFGASALADCMFMAIEANLGQPSPNGKALLSSIYNISALFACIGFTSFLGALGLSGFLRNALLGLLSLGMAVVSFLALVTIFSAQVAMFTP